MSIKLFLLKSGETVVADAKQLVSSDDNLIHAYVLENPYKIQISKNDFLVLNEEQTATDDPSKKEHQVQILMSKWIVLADDNEIQIPFDWVVTVVNPVKSVIKMYEEKANG